MRYKVILYNGGKRVKSFGTFDKYSEANEFYQLKLANNTVLFPKYSTWMGSGTDFELVLVGPPEGKHLDHVKTEDGRTITLKTSGDHTIKKVSEYYVEEKFLYKNQDRKLQFKTFVKEFLVQISGDKTFYLLSNKVVLEEYDTGSLHLFTLKNRHDSQRLFDTIKQFCFANDIYNNFYFEHLTIEVRKNLYDRLEAMGFDRDYLKRCATR